MALAIDYWEAIDLKKDLRTEKIVLQENGEWIFRYSYFETQSELNGLGYDTKVDDPEDVRPHLKTNIEYALFDKATDSQRERLNLAMMQILRFLVKFLILCRSIKIRCVTHL